jgi:hypothetical protein
MYNGFVPEGNALITNYKQFELEEITEGVYKSLKNENFYYITIPKELDWEGFKNMTLSIKNSYDLVSFDAAYGIFYINDVVEDVVRIYAQDANERSIIDIREKYLNKL